MKKYIIILISMLLFAGSMANAQTIKHSKQKTKTEQLKTHNKSSRDKKSQKAESSSSQSSQATNRHAETTAYDVTFTCNVNNADMYIDGNDYGKPNGTRTLKTGSHQVKLVAEGFEEYTTSIHVKAGSTSFYFKMTKESHKTKSETFTVNGISFDMIFVEGGTFTMGASREQDKDATSYEQPSHQVTLSSFYIGKYEVTQELWEAVMGNNPSNFKDNLQCPVESVSWNDCQEFITQLNRLTGRCFRLPTEAEWEYAARGGNRSQSYKYSGSNMLYASAWYTDNSGSTTHPVGQKIPNELGLYDLSGNVSEWCQDWYGSYSSRSQSNPTGPASVSSGSGRVYRGGGWGSSTRGCRISYRSDGGAAYRYYSLGVRLAL